ncbi:MAG: DUF5644 domain-containing protein [Campylobacteraceae bacterium]|jgi:succinate dehydrogenase/fumarate reductase-like Fe-S protein|nr:DUF5644 domain-containing protein [Campylobacteraceae bacterium]
MSYTLNISAFRFNAKTDFLPYYKKYKVEADENIQLLDILNLIKQQDKNFSFSNNSFLAIKVNQIGVYTDTPIKTIIEKFGTLDLKLDPISEFRAIDDLDMDTSDFDKKIDILKPFVKEKDDEKYYHELISYYYISPALEFERGYFGDSLLLFAIFLIKKYPQNRDDILKIVSDEHYGIWLHVSYENLITDYQNTINIENNISELKREILKHVPNTNSTTKREAKRIRNLNF